MSEHDTTQFDIPHDDFLAAVSPPDLRGRINLRLEQVLQKEIEDVAEDSRYPLNSVSEVVRYCCLVGMEHLRAWKPKPNMLGQIKTATALVIRDKLQCESLDLLTRLDERVDWYIEHGFYDEVIDLVAKVRGYFDGFPDDFWATHIQTEIDKRFAVWMDRIDSLG